jgi:hypothetical protein
VQSQYDPCKETPGGRESVAWLARGREQLPIGVLQSHRPVAENSDARFAKWCIHAVASGIAGKDDILDHGLRGSGEAGNVAFAVR